MTGEQPIAVIRDSQREVIVVGQRGPAGVAGTGLSPSLNGYVKGDGAGNFTAVASIPQADLTLSGDLLAVEALSGTGIAVRTASNTWALRALVIAAGLSITNPLGVAGDLTLGLANDLAAIEGLSSTGFAARTGTDAWASRTLTAPGAGFTITNPAGVAGNPTFVLANDLGAIEALATTGYPRRTGTDTWVLETQVPWGSLSGTPTTLVGYGITDGQPLDSDLTAIAGLSSNGYARRTGAGAWTIDAAVPWGSLSSTPTTLVGYGITDAQPLDGDLTAIAALSGTGLAARTSSNTWAQRSLTQPAAGLTISNPAGVAGDPTFALANDLAALEGLSTTGYARRTGTDAWTIDAAIPWASLSGVDADLDAIAALSGTGFAVRTGSNTWANRSLTQPAAGFTITNPAGVAGDPTFALADDLAALEALAATGIVARTAASTWVPRTITGTNNRLSVSNGDGVAGNPTLDVDANYVGQASITTLGTIGTGVWNAGAVSSSSTVVATTSMTAGTFVAAGTEVRTPIVTSNAASALALKTSGGIQVNIGHVGSAVNYVELLGNVTTGAPRIRVNGSDTNINWVLGTKGQGVFQFFTDALGTAPEQFRIDHTAGATRFITVTGSNGGNPKISVSAGNLDIAAPVVLTGQTVGSTVGAAGGASALPATPLGYLTTAINGTACKVPYYTV